MSQLVFCFLGLIWCYGCIRSGDVLAREFICKCARWRVEIICASGRMRISICRLQALYLISWKNEISAKSEVMLFSVNNVLHNLDRIVVLMRVGAKNFWVVIETMLRLSVIEIVAVWDC